MNFLFWNCVVFFRYFRPFRKMDRKRLLILGVPLILGGIVTLGASIAEFYDGSRELGFILIVLTLFIFSVGGYISYLGCDCQTVHRDTSRVLNWNCFKVCFNIYKKSFKRFSWKCFITLDCYGQLFLLLKTNFIVLKIYFYVCIYIFKYWNFRVDRTFNFVNISCSDFILPSNFIAKEC